MLSLVLLGLAAAQSYPELAVIGAFRDVCVSPVTAAASTAAAESGGWRHFEPAPDERLARLLVRTRQSAQSTGATVLIGTYFKIVSGRRLELALIKIRANGSAEEQVDCIVYDFSATAALTEGAVATLNPTPPTHWRYAADIHYQAWEPGISGPRSSLRLGFVPADSPLGQRFGLVGLSLAASNNLEIN
jgi:hypothetical protein